MKVIPMNLEGEPKVNSKRTIQITKNQEKSKQKSIKKEKTPKQKKTQIRKDEDS